MISGGIPADADAWPDGLLDHLRRFEQGHLIRGLPFFYFGDPALPLFGGASNAEADALVWHEQEFPFGLILTQTCDLQEVGVRRPRKPWLHCCPVYRADDLSAAISADLLAQVRKGKVEYLLEVPNVPEAGVWVADLRLVMPLEKGFLLSKDPIDGFPDELTRRAVGERVALLHSRPAFDDALVTLVVDPLVKELSAMAKKDIGLYEAVSNDVYALAVRSDRLVSMSLESVELLLLCWKDLSSDALEFWESQSEAWSQSALRTQSHRLQSLQVVTLADLSAEDFLRLQVVPLRGLTPHPLWHAD